MPVAEDLNGYAFGRLHDELAWRDAALHACRVLQTDGYRIVVVPDDIAAGGRG